jgi:lactate racemase
MLRESPSREEFLRRILNAPVTIDQWQLEKLALVAEKSEVLFYVPGLPREYHTALWGRAFATAAAAVEALTASLAPGAAIAVIPEGPYVLAKVGQAEAVLI